MRIDKWMWAARFFKTRGMASRACELGRVEWNGQISKPAREVKLNDRLKITNEGGTFEVDVLELSEVRGPAAVAQTLYRETEGSKAAREQAREERRALRAVEVLPEARPNTRDRRQLRRLRGRG